MKKIKLNKNFGKISKTGLKNAMEFGKKFEGLKYTMAKVCPNCFEKGYHTEFSGGAMALADFIGDKTYMVKNPGVVIRFCKCNRGEDLKKFFDLKKEYK